MAEYQLQTKKEDMQWVYMAASLRCARFTADKVEFDSKFVFFHIDRVEGSLSTAPITDARRSISSMPVGNEPCRGRLIEHLSSTFGKWFLCNCKPFPSRYRTSRALLPARHPEDCTIATTAGVIIISLSAPILRYHAS
jgi:hypothetical protein